MRTLFGKNKGTSAILFDQETNTYVSTCPSITILQTRTVGTARLLKIFSIRVNAINTTLKQLLVE